MQMKKVLGGMAAIAVAGLFGANSANAAVAIQFDGNGGADGFQSVNTFDWAPGNALSVGAITAIQSGVGSTFDTYYQARMVALQDTNGNIVTGDGGLLNAAGATGYELTAVAGFTEVVTATGGVGTPTSFGLAGSPSVNFFSIYYDASKNSDNLAGTGFSDGSLILSAEVTSVSSFFAPTGGPGLLDQFGADDWGGQLSLSGIGVTQITAKVTSTDASFFQNVPNTLVFTFFNTSQVLPFQQVNPSHLVAGIAPSIGTVNGLNGPDVLFQADANQSFDLVVVPEPMTASLGLLSIGGLLLGTRRRRIA